MKLSDLTSKTKQVEFDFDGEPVHMEVRTQLITPKLIADMEALTAKHFDGANLCAVSEHLARLVVKWDFLDNDGVTMFPLDVDRLVAEIPLEFQMHCLAAAIGSMKPGEAKAPKD